MSVGAIGAEILGGGGIHPPPMIYESQTPHGFRGEGPQGASLIIEIGYGSM